MNTVTVKQQSNEVTEYENDIPLNIAIAAHNGTSFSPESRGQYERRSYSEGLVNDRAELLAMCRNDQERAQVEAFFQQYREIMRRLTLECLHSKSNVVSSMIAGPSNFPVQRMEKRARWAHQKLEHMTVVRDKLLKRIKRQLRPELRPIMSGDTNATERLREKINKAERMQAAMKACNAVIRQHTKAGRDVQVAALIALGRTESQACELLKPDFAGRVGFPDYALTNNNANIRRMKQRLASISRNQSIASTEAEGANARFEDSPPENRVRLFYPGKPDEQVRSRLKRCGFRWTPTLGCWQAYRNPHTISTAKELAGV